MLNYIKKGQRNRGSNKRKNKYLCQFKHLHFMNLSTTNYTEKEKDASKIDLLIMVRYLTYDN